MTGARARGVAALVVVAAVAVLGGSAISQWRERWSGAASDTTRHANPSTRVRVEVLNGGGQAGAAREATELLRDMGFDVVFFGNASDFGRDSSVVLDRVGALEPARDVADALGIRNVLSQPDPNLYLDVSVVLGRDWIRAAVPQERDGEAPERAWWDPRGWFRR